MKESGNERTKLIYLHVPVGWCIYSMTNTGQTHISPKRSWTHPPLHKVQ